MIDRLTDRLPEQRSDSPNDRLSGMMDAGAAGILRGGKLDTAPHGHWGMFGQDRYQHHKDIGGAGQMDLGSASLPIVWSWGKMVTCTARKEWVSSGRLDTGFVCKSSVLSNM